MVSEREIKLEQDLLGLDYMQAYYRVKARKEMKNVSHSNRWGYETRSTRYV